MYTRTSREMLRKEAKTEENEREPASNWLDRFRRKKRRHFLSHFSLFRPQTSLLFLQKKKSQKNAKDGTPIPVRITAYADKSYDYTMKTPPTSHLLKSAAGVAKGAQKPGHASSSVGSVSAAAVLEIARIKAADLPPHVPLRSVAKSVAATARSMGVKVVG